ncbi:DUF2142 domain-containing protein [Nocardia aurantia]|uniref:DUF2142 domain-containing protein n=1 Tax=Nocardia aurantia TaxID=2585199 RepID=A0A7K0DMA2_9NOCA|nr:DUF2142 domain-containing protein [Nocardia aurantia]MQY26885.1 hypothetical protein [Nocardia aurantia]
MTVEAERAAGNAAPTPAGSEAKAAVDSEHAVPGTESRAAADSATSDADGTGAGAAIGTGVGAAMDTGVGAAVDTDAGAVAHTGVTAVADTAVPGVGHTAPISDEAGASADTEQVSPRRPDTSALRRAASWTDRNIGSAATVFVVVAALFGVIFSVLTPAFWGHDEITQFGRAYQVAHGGFTPQRIEDARGVAYGGQIPLSIDGLMSYAFEDYNRNGEEPDPLMADPGAYRQIGAAPITSATKQIWFTNTAAYSPVAYVPAAVGIRIAEATGLNVSATVELTRLCGLLAYLVIVGFALRALRRHRVQWLAFTVSVLPIALFQAGTVTADTATNALAILVSCLLVKGLFLGTPLTATERVIALATTLLLPLSKPTYVLLAMLVVLIPAREFGFSQWRKWIPWCVAAVGAIGFAAWMKIAAPTGDGMGLMRPERQWHSVRPGDQLHGIIGHPVHFATVFADSTWLRDQRWFTQFFGELGFAYVDVPALTILACLLAFAVSVGIAERFTTGHRRTAIVGLTILASVAMIYVTLYMSFTPVDYYLIDGVQGRYFVPLAIVGLTVLLRWIPVRLTDSRGRTPTRGAAILIVAATLVGLIAAVVKYHYLVWG